MFWQDPLYNPIGPESEKIHLKIAEMLPEANYVRLQPTLPQDKVFAFDDHESNQELCQIACDYIRDNQEQINKALNILM